VVKKYLHKLFGYYRFYPILHPQLFIVLNVRNSHLTHDALCARKRVIPI
jgi:hypothetical protein